MGATSVISHENAPYLLESADDRRPARPSQLTITTLQPRRAQVIGGWSATTRAARLVVQ